MLKPITTDIIKINNVFTEIFKNKHLPDIVQVKENLSSLRVTIANDPDNVLIHTAAFLNILFTIKRMFENEEFKIHYRSLRNEVKAKTHLISALELLETEVQKIFKKDCVIFKPAMSDARPRAENIWVVIDDIQHTLLSAHNSKESVERKELMRKILISMSNSRLTITTCIENIEHDIKELCFN